MVDRGHPQASSSAFEGHAQVAPVENTLTLQAGAGLSRSPGTTASTVARGGQCKEVLVASSTSTAILSPPRPIASKDTPCLGHQPIGIATVSFAAGPVLHEKSRQNPFHSIG